MARIDTLPHFLTDVADAIREKTGSSETIQASDFDTEIANIPSGSATITSVSELKTGLMDAVHNFDDYITSFVNSYPSEYTNEMTLYSPSADTPYYLIRKRYNAYQLIWFPLCTITFQSNSYTNTFLTGGVIIRTQGYGKIEDENLTNYFSSPIVCGVDQTGQVIEGYMSPSYNTLEELITAIQTQNVSYSTGRGNSWGYERYSEDYYFPYTNMPVIDKDGNLVNNKKLSSNEIIRTIE